jgi:ribosomal protein S25
LIKAREMSVAELARKYGVCDPIARRWLKDAGVVTSKIANVLLMKIDQIADAVRMRTERISVRAIADQLGISAEYAQMLLRGFAAKPPMPARRIAWCRKAYAAVHSGVRLLTIAKRAHLSTTRAAEFLAYYMGFVARERIEVTVTVVVKPGAKSNPK